MGVNWNHTKALLACYRSGMNFGRVLTVGRLNLFISPHELRALVAQAPELAAKYDQYLAEHPVYAEPLYKLFGATEVESMDASDYEHATHVHDLNQPLPDSLKERFDFVDDGGTIEHVFNFPQAIKNCMEMVKVGGHLQINCPANNLLGHGFYQFSPDVFFRVLSEDNGYQMVRMVAYEMFDGSQWYEVADPRTVKGRVQLVNGSIPVNLMVLARRVAKVNIFEKTPQQSDYVQTWSDGPSDSRAIFMQKPSGWRSWLKKTIEGASPAMLRWIKSKKTARAAEGQFSFKNQPQHFKPVEG